MTLEQASDHDMKDKSHLSVCAFAADMLKMFYKDLQHDLNVKKKKKAD